MRGCFGNSVRHSREMIKLIRATADLSASQIVQHHFIASETSETRNRNGSKWCSQCAILEAKLDLGRYIIDQSECTATAKVREEAVLSDEWVEETAKLMCALAELSGTVYAGWEWLGAVTE
jgi:hypothetical protein